METEAALVGAGGLLLLRVGGNERAVDVEDHLRRRGRLRPDSPPRTRAGGADRLQPLPVERVQQLATPSRPRRPRQPATADRATPPDRQGSHRHQRGPHREVAHNPARIVTPTMLPQPRPAPRKARPSTRPGQRQRQQAQCPHATSNPPRPQRPLRSPNEIGCTHTVNLLSRDGRPRQPDSSLLRRTSPPGRRNQPTSFMKIWASRSFGPVRPRWFAPASPVPRKPGLSG